MNLDLWIVYLKTIIWNAIENENNKDSYLSGTRSYWDDLRICKNSLVIDEYSIRVAASPVEAEFIICITAVQNFLWTVM